MQGICAFPNCTLCILYEPKVCFFGWGGDLFFKGFFCGWPRRKGLVIGCLDVYGNTMNNGEQERCKEEMCLSYNLNFSFLCTLIVFMSASFCYWWVSMTEFQWLGFNDRVSMTEFLWQSFDDRVLMTEFQWQSAIKVIHRHNLQHVNIYTNRSQYHFIINFISQSVYFIIQFSFYQK